jgi:pilus assembly protein CpaB
MRLGRVILIILLILVIGGGAIGYVYLQGNQSRGAVESTAVPPTPTVRAVEKVVVVSQNIARGQEITESVIFITEIDKSTYDALPGWLTSVEDVIGRRAKFDIIAGTPLVANMLADAGGLSPTGSDWALDIPQGFVAVSIPITRLSSVSFAPRRGDHVNVIVTLSFVDLDADFQTKLPNGVASVIAPGPQGEDGPNVLTITIAPVSDAVQGRTQPELQLEQTLYVVPSEEQRSRLVSQTLIENVIVLQMGTFPLEEEMEETPEPTPAPTAEQQGGVVTNQPAATPTPVPEVVVERPDVVTLLVKPQDAVTLNYLMYAGAQLTLALRSPLDSSVAQTDAVTLQYLLETYNIPIPVKLPYGVDPRVDDLILPTLPNDASTPIPSE